MAFGSELLVIFQILSGVICRAQWGLLAASPASVLVCHWARIVPLGSFDSSFHDGSISIPLAPSMVSRRAARGRRAEGWGDAAAARGEKRGFMFPLRTTASKGCGPAGRKATPGCS